jgi:hypothetical protein
MEGHLNKSETVASKMLGISIEMGELQWLPQ